MFGEFYKEVLFFYDCGLGFVCIRFDRYTVEIRNTAVAAARLYIRFWLL